MLENIKGIIFDLDGTLVESDLDFSAIRREIGCPDDLDLLAYIETLPFQAKQEAEAVVEKHELIDAKKTQLIEGAFEFYKLAQSLEKKLALVTRNSPRATQTKLKQTELMFETVLTRNDCQPKPHPEALLIVLEKWKLLPQSVVYIGDYKYDIEAANNAGVKSLLYTSQNTPSYANEADMVFSCWHELKDRLL